MGVPAGPWHIDDTLTFTTNTHDVATGAGTDADAVPSYRIYEDETGTAILTGNMAKLDDANTVGFYSEQITLSAANGFEVGKSYSIYVAATVDSVAATSSYNFKVSTTPPTADGIADALLDRTNGIEASYTLRQAMRLILAAAAGPSTGLETGTATYKNPAASKDRIIMDVDANGNRSSPTYDVS